MSKAYELIKVEWLDSMFINGWQLVEDINITLENNISCGFIIKENKKTICIASNKTSDNSSCSGIIVIPKCSIVKIKSISLAD